MQHTPLLFLIAGTHRLREMTGGYWSVFFNLCEPIEIGTLKEPDTRWLITEPVKNWYTVRRPAQDEIIRVAGCHPYFTQVLCKKVWEVRNEYKITEVDVSHVREAVDRALRTGEDQIGYPWTEADCCPDERLILSVLARVWSEATPVTEEVLRRRLDEAGLIAAAGAAINRLQVRGVVRQVDADGIAFVVPLLQHWIVRKRYDNLAAALRYNEEHQAVQLGGDPPDV